MIALLLNIALGAQYFGTCPPADMITACENLANGQNQGTDLGFCDVDECEYRTCVCTPPSGLGQSWSCVIGTNTCDPGQTTASKNGSPCKVKAGSCGDDPDPDPDPVDKDKDGDGHDKPADCNDNNPNIHPGADEVCDNKDNDCDGDVDEDDSDLQDAESWYVDADKDSYGTGSLQSGCNAPAASASRDGDCDDDDKQRNPGATETCDGIDNDCDGAADDADPDVVGGQRWYTDLDGDGFGTGNPTIPLCATPPDSVLVAGDCDDADNGIHPDAAELCNSLDDDCDTDVDEGFDLDGDGFRVCDADCQDLLPEVHPGAPEVLDGLDNDCDNWVDEGTPAFDDDWDGVSEDDGDCDDGNPLAFPGAPEMVDGVDNDCDGVVDEGTEVFDDDGDGLAEIDGDCDDTDPSVFSGALETPYDGIDQDCADGDLRDVDGDGQEVVPWGLDCDDTAVDVFFGAMEVPYDAIDQDCSGADLRDVDGDGHDAFVVGGQDCDDEDPARNPDEVDLPYDGIDQDCSGADLVDVDTDGSPYPTDCDDEDPDRSPAFAEDPSNGIDDDCDGAIDEASGCATAPAGATGSLLVLLALLAAGRARAETIQEREESALMGTPWTPAHDRACGALVAGIDRATPVQSGESPDAAALWERVEAGSVRVPAHSLQLTGARCDAGRQLATELQAAGADTEALLADVVAVCEDLVRRAHEPGLRQHALSAAIDAHLAAGTDPARLRALLERLLFEFPDASFADSAELATQTFDLAFRSGNRSDPVYNRAAIPHLLLAYEAAGQRDAPIEHRNGLVHRLAHALARDGQPHAVVALLKRHMLSGGPETGSAGFGPEDELTRRLAHAHRDAGLVNTALADYRAIATRWETPDAYGTFVLHLAQAIARGARDDDDIELRVRHLLQHVPHDHPERPAADRLEVELRILADAPGAVPHWVAAQSPDPAWTAQGQALLQQLARTDDVVQAKAALQLAPVLATHPAHDALLRHHATGRAARTLHRTEQAVDSWLAASAAIPAFVFDVDAIAEQAQYDPGACAAHARKAAETYDARVRPIDFAAQAVADVLPPADGLTFVPPPTPQPLDADEALFLRVSDAMKERAAETPPSDSPAWTTARVLQYRAMRYAVNRGQWRLATVRGHWLLSHDVDVEHRDAIVVALLDGYESLQDWERLERHASSWKGDETLSRPVRERAWAAMFYAWTLTVEALADRIEARRAYTALRPDDAEQWLLLGDDFRSEARYDEAIAAWQRAFTVWPAASEALADHPARRDELDAGMVRALDRIALWQDLRGDREAAIATLDRLIAVTDDPEAAMRRAFLASADEAHIALPDLQARVDALATVPLDALVPTLAGIHTDMEPHADKLEAYVLLGRAFEDVAERIRTEPVPSDVVDVDWYQRNTAEQAYDFEDRAVPYYAAVATADSDVFDVHRRFAADRLRALRPGSLPALPTGTVQFGTFDDVHTTVGTASRSWTELASTLHDTGSFGDCQIAVAQGIDASGPDVRLRTIGAACELGAGHAHEAATTLRAVLRDAPDDASAASLLHRIERRHGLGDVDVPGRPQAMQEQLRLLEVESAVVHCPDHPVAARLAAFSPTLDTLDDPRPERHAHVLAFLDALADQASTCTETP